MIRDLLIAPACLLALGACAGKTPPPAAGYDAASFMPARLSLEPPVQIAAPPMPTALPGPTLPAPAEEVPAEPVPPEARVKAANRAALREPKGDGYVNAVQVYPFVEGSLYRLYTAPERVSDIALEPGETLIAVAAGDTVRWVIGDTTSGSGAERRTHILVKPTAAGLDTNLVITTDRRVYHLQLESTAKTAMAMIAWTYPQDPILAIRRPAAAGSAGPIAGGVAPQDLRFRYAISGDEPPWRPLRAFDDGRQVFIEFPARIEQGQAPPLFVVGTHGQTELVNYRVRGHYYIVDRLFAAAELRLGGKRQQVVRITRTDAAERSGRRGSTR